MCGVCKKSGKISPHESIHIESRADFDRIKEKYVVTQTNVEYSCTDCGISTITKYFSVRFPLRCPACNQRATSMAHYGVPTPMLTKEVQDKLARTNLERYGVENVFQSEKIKDKIKQTVIEKYGVDNVFKSPEIREKQSQTVLEKYGVENVSQSIEIKQKKKEAAQARYGVDNVAQAEEVAQKTKSTLLERYGSECALRGERAIEKTKRTMLERYGVEKSFQSPEILEKARQTIHDRYGLDRPPTGQLIYDGRNFDSSWELAYYIWLKDHQIPFEYQPDMTLVYIVHGEKRRYFPDFLVNGQLVEIKGDHFFNSKGELINPYGHDPDARYKGLFMEKLGVRILKSAEIKPYLDYVKNKYGKDFLNSFRKRRLLNKEVN